MGDNLLLSGTAPAERSVIGSMLVDDGCIPAVLAQLDTEDFSDGTCRETFRAIRDLFMAARPVDPVTVVDAMQGGDNYRQWVAEVMIDTPTAANAATYADITRRGATLRRLRTLADELLVCGDVDEARGLVDRMSAAMSATSKMPRMSGRDLAADFVARMQSKDRPDYLPWGLPTLDRVIQSELGDFNVLGGYPSAGKTLLSLQMALAMAKRFRVGYYSLETRPEKLADRLFSHLAAVPMGKIKRRDLAAGDWPKLAAATSGFTEHCPFDVIRAAGSTVADVAADAAARQYQVIFIDYVQLLRVPGIKPGDRYSIVTSISTDLHLFAQRHNVAVIALSQLTRPEKTKDGKVPPDLHSLRESGQIEQDADSVILVYPKDANDNRSNRMVKVAKNKDGPRAALEVSFDGATQTMTEVAEDRDGRVVASHYSDIGRAAKSRNRREAEQMQFAEYTGSQRNPWKEVGNDT